jgi:hypothetical protein
VFLRLEREHEIVTGLFQNETQLDRAIERNVSEGRSPEELLIVEFCDTSDDAGLFRSYAAFIAGERVIPRHILFGTQWKLKVPDLRDEERLGEQWDYLTAHPHEAWLRRIFAFAGVDYGKIDYSLLDGKPQVWEINTNPVILMPPSQYDQAELPAQELFAERIKSAFEAIDDVPPEGGGFTVVVSPLTPDGDG